MTGFTDKKKPQIKKTPVSLEKAVGLPYYILLAVLIVFPFSIMILYAFNNANTGVFQIQFSLSNFTDFLSQPIFIRTMMESMYLATISTLISLVIAYPLSYIIVRQSTKKQLLLILLLTAPMWINMLIRANGLKQIFSMVAPNLLGTDFAIITGMVYMYLPYMVLPIYTSLSKIDDSLYESSADLGANKLQTIRKVIIPLSLSGVMSGIMMVFLPAATTLVVPKYLGDGKRYM
ncbi:MAG: ABC transporter permease, partial [Candidatus Phytoplasma sp.]|nr:ABC transporter permease [Phytoplasma sp.]